VAFVGTDAKLRVGEPRREMLGVSGGHDAVGVALPEPYRDSDVSEAEAQSRLNWMRSRIGATA
jgi:hypothetical protein